MCFKTNMTVLLILYTVFVNLQIKSVLLIELDLVKSSESYGPFELEVTYFAVRRGPKLRNCTIPQVSIEQTIKGEYVYRENITYLEDSELSEVKLKMLSVKDNKKSIILKYAVKKPCQHFMISKMVEQHFNATNCIIKKGWYNMSFKYSELIENFFGKSFFYGEYEFRAVIVATRGNILSFVHRVVFKKPGSKLPV